jgi:hypothetical protein
MHKRLREKNKHCQPDMQVVLFVGDVQELIEKFICLLRGHSWAGGSWYIMQKGIGLDRRLCGRCCEERSFVE